MGGGLIKRGEAQLNKEGLTEEGEAWQGGGRGWECLIKKGDYLLWVGGQGFLLSVLIVRGFLHVGLLSFAFCLSYQQAEEGFAVKGQEGVEVAVLA